MEQFVFNCILVKTHVVDAQGKDIKELKLGGTYGHLVECCKNYAVWPLEVDVIAKVVEPDQLVFVEAGREVPSWGYSATLPPNYGAGERSSTLVYKVKKSTKALIQTVVSLLERSDVLSLELRLK
jgi:hypothetical protein